MFWGSLDSAPNQFFRTPTHTQTRRCSGLIALVTAVSCALVMLLATPASADDSQWNLRKGDCDYVLKAPDRYPLPSLGECVILWEQYKDVSKLSPDERSLFARGFSWLFIYGDQNQKSIAQGALGRVQKPKPLCLYEGSWRDPNVGQSCTASGGGNNGGKLQRLPKIAVKKASKRAQKKAKRSNSKGYRHYKKRRYAQAVQQFQSALKQHPFYTKAKYNLACNLSLLGDRDGAIQHLLELDSWDDPEAQAQFQGARLDKDFEPLHNDARFRQLVGLIRVQLLNGAGDVGLYHVGQVYKKLKNRGLYVAQYGFDRHVRKRPLIYYRKGYEAQGKMAREMVSNPRTAMAEIQWDSPFDLVIVWGDPDYAKRENVSGPVVQGTITDGQGDDPSKYLNKFKDAKGTAQDAKDTATDTANFPNQ